MNNQNAFCTAPVANTTHDHTASETPAISLRGWRSASVLIGIDPTRKSTPNAPPIAPKTASLTPSVRWMSGARIPTAAVSNDAVMRAMPSVSTSALPPARSASRIDIGSPPTPGNRSSGRTTRSAPCCASWRRASSSSTVAAKAATLSGDLDGLIRTPHALSGIGADVAQVDEIEPVVLRGRQGAADGEARGNGAERFDAADDRTL